MALRNIIGLILVFLGAAYLLDRLEIFIFDNIFSDWWPLLLVAVGVINISGNKRSVTFSLMMIFFGVIILIDNLGYLPGSMWDIIWPVMLVILGISLLTSSTRRKKALKGSLKDLVNITTVFSGNEEKVESKEFRGGIITTIFGGTELDLRYAGISSEGCELDITTVFGGVTIIVPENWRLHTSGTPFLGALENKTMNAFEPDDDSPVLNIHYFVMFGGIEIKNKKKIKTH